VASARPFDLLRSIADFFNRIGQEATSRNLGTLLTQTRFSQAAMKPTVGEFTGVPFCISDVAV
jgi:hypothetical protein